MYIYSYIQEYLKYAKVMNREIQIKMTIKYHFTPTGIDITQKTKNWQGYGELEPSHTVGGTVNDAVTFGKQFSSLLKC